MEMNKVNSGRLRGLSAGSGSSRNPRAALFS